MIKIVFHNLEPSDLAKHIVMARMQSVTKRFPELISHKITVTLSMDNSPTQAGPDSFKVKVYITGKKYNSVVIEKSAYTLYLALADVIEHTLERLNRFGDKTRVIKRQLARKASNQIAF